MDDFHRIGDGSEEWLETKKRSIRPANGAWLRVMLPATPELTS